MPSRFSTRATKRKPLFRTGPTVGINQVVWDVATRSLDVSADEMLGEHTRYALIVTRGVRDAAGNPIAPSTEFERFRHDVNGADDPASHYDRRALLTAEWAARRSGVQNDNIAALSVFTTQSTTSLGLRVVAQVRGGVPRAAADFNVAPGGAPSVYARGAIASLTWNQHTLTSRHAHGVGAEPRTAGYHSRRDRPFGVRPLRVAQLHGAPGRVHSRDSDTNRRHRANRH
jgi:hypothetical protein